MAHWRDSRKRKRFLSTRRQHSDFGEPHRGARLTTRHWFIVSEPHAIEKHARSRWNGTPLPLRSPVRVTVQKGDSTLSPEAPDRCRVEAQRVKRSGEHPRLFRSCLASFLHCTAHRSSDANGMKNDTVPARTSVEAARLGLVEAGPPQAGESDDAAIEVRRLSVDPAPAKPRLHLR